MTLTKSFHLAFQLAKVEFKLRNEGSYLGILWYLINPILFFSVLFLIFFDRLGQSIPQYPLYLFLGIIMFNFFQTTTTEVMTKLWGNRELIISIPFPKQVLIASNVMTYIFSHLFELFLFVLLLIFFKIPIYNILFYLPILFFLILFTYGSCLILSSISVYIMDLKNIWLFLIRLIWIGTPIFYAIEGQNRLFLINLFNPMYYFITIARDLIIYSQLPPLWLILIPLVFTLSFLIVGLILFNKLQPKFAELM